MEKVVILVYADDIVILAENEQDLQKLLDIMHRWSQECQMMVNVDKTTIVHFCKAPSIPDISYIPIWRTTDPGSG